MWDPDPYAPHPEGPWHERHFNEACAGVDALMERFREGRVSRKQLLHGKDNHKEGKYDTLSYWLYFQHHPGHERWKLLGQRYWSLEAWQSWRSHYQATSPSQRNSRKDRLPSLQTLPKRKAAGLVGLVSEHVVPKKKLKELILEGEHAVAELLALNLCCVVTIAEDKRLERDTHPDPFDPWARYRGTSIELLFNPGWSEAEITPLKRHGLLSERSSKPME